MKLKDTMKAITAGELLNRDLAPREFVINPWLRAGESALIWAGTGVGKTWMTLSLAIAIAGGGRVWEWKAPRPRKVLLIDGEMNIQDLRDRINLLTTTEAVKDLDLKALHKNLNIIARQDQDPNSSFYDITETSSQRLILDRLNREGLEVVFIDNMTTCADGLKDENDATAFRAIMSFMLLMKQANKTAILVHHANKSGSDARGSSALDATFEVKLGLLRPQGGAVDKACFKADFGKLRARGLQNVTSPKVWRLEDTGWVVEDDMEAIEHQVLEKLKTLNFVNQNEIANELGKSQSTVSRALTKITAEHGKDLVDGLFIKAREIRKNLMASEIEDDY